MNQGLVFVLIVTLVTWFGIFAYLIKVDLSLREIEKGDRDTHRDSGRNVSVRHNKDTDDL